MLGIGESSATGAFRVGFLGAPEDGESVGLRVGCRWLGGSPVEAIPGGRVGCVSEPFVAGELADRARSLYRRLLRASEGLHLYRIWNYLPAINAASAGMENYRAFCQGRSLAFEEVFGPDYTARLPAGSAVGAHGDQVHAIFVAGAAAPTHFENPEQVPAYRYPPEHGPRPPSFSRATVVRPGNRTCTFVSGTSSIKGHATIEPAATGGQLECTLDNLRLISRAAGLGGDLAAGMAARRQFKVYLRHAADLGLVRRRLEDALLQPADTVSYLQADICRAALNVEIEATIFT